MTEEDIKELESLHKDMENKYVYYKQHGTGINDENYDDYWNVFRKYQNLCFSVMPKLIKALREEWEWKARFINDSDTYKLGVEEGIKQESLRVVEYYRKLLSEEKEQNNNYTVYIIKKCIRELYSEKENLNEDISNKKG